jgi:hypothetical protein
MKSAPQILQAFSTAHMVLSQSLRALCATSAVAVIALTCNLARAQADFEKGYQAFQSYHGSDFDTVNLANGNLVLNIPLLSYEQRGGVPPVTISIRSNSTTFQSTPPFINGPEDTQQHEVASGVIGAPWGQPHVLISPGGLFWKEERIVTSAKTAIGPEYLVRFVAIDDSGATHSLAGGIANSTAGYVPGIKYSVDGSGLMLQPGTAATGPVLVDRKGNTGGLADPNGNAITLQGQCAAAPGSGDFFDPSLPSWEGYAHGKASATKIQAISLPWRTIAVWSIPTHPIIQLRQRLIQDLQTAACATHFQQEVRLPTRRKTIPRHITPILSYFPARVG